MRPRDARFGFRLRASVVRHGRERIVLDVRLALPAVEDDVGGEVDEPRADRRGGARDVLRALDVDARVLLAVRRVDHDLRPQPLEEVAHRVGVADLDPFGGRVGPQPDELGAEVAGRAGDVQLSRLEAIRRVA